MRASGVGPDVTTYNVAIAACQRAGRWETAGALQAGRDAVGGRPEWPENLLAFNAALRRHDVRSRQVSSKVSSKVSWKVSSGLVEGVVKGVVAAGGAHVAAGDADCI